MVQTFTDIVDTDTIELSLPKILDRDKTALSQSSGTAFPTADLEVGMGCYRTDELKLYVLADATPTWTLVHDFNKTIQMKEDADALYALQSNNLSDLADFSAARANLGLTGFRTRNALINGNFSIWPGLLAGVGHDNVNAEMWFENFNTSDGISISRQRFTPGQTDVPGEPEFFLRAAVTAGGTGGVNDQRQKIENVRTFAGQEVTLSYWLRATTSFTQLARKVTQTFGAGGSVPVTTGLPNISVTPTWTRFASTFVMPSISGKVIGTGANFLDVVIGFPVNVTTTVEYAQAQLELGSEATDFEWEHPAIIQAKVERYFEKSYDADTPPGAVTDAGMMEYQTLGVFNAQHSWPFKTRKRAVPAIIQFSNATGAAGFHRSISQVDDIAINSEGVGQSAFSSATVAGSPPLGDLMRFHYTANARL